MQSESYMSGWNLIVEAHLNECDCWPKLKRPKDRREWAEYDQGYYDARYAYAVALGDSIGTGKPLEAPGYI